MGQPMTQQLQQEVKADLSIKPENTANMVQVGEHFFGSIEQIINYVNSFAFDRTVLVNMLKETEAQGYTLYQP